MIQNKRKGFSLVELIVVIAIMAVLVLVLAPALLQHNERSRAEKDNKTMDEVVNAIELALADQEIYDEVLQYSTTDNISCYVDTNSEANYQAIITKRNPDGIDQYTFDSTSRQLDETPYFAAGNMRGVTITFAPNKGSNGSTFDLRQGVVNQYIQIKGNQRFGAMPKLYGRVKSSVGEMILNTSQTYRNSEYTVFIVMGTIGGKDESAQSAVRMYGQWSGTNLPAEISYQLVTDRVVGDTGNTIVDIDDNNWNAENGNKITLKPGDLNGGGSFTPTTSTGNSIEDGTNIAYGKLTGTLKIDDILYSGVKIDLIGMKQYSAETDSSGRFEIEVLEEGNYNVNVTYNSNEWNVLVNINGETNIMWDFSSDGAVNSQIENIKDNETPEISMEDVVSLIEFNVFEKQLSGEPGYKSIEYIYYEPKLNLPIDTYMGQQTTVSYNPPGVGSSTIEGIDDYCGDYVVFDEKRERDITIGEIKYYGYGLSWFFPKTNLEQATKENMIYLAAYTNKERNDTNAHVAKWNGSHYERCDDLDDDILEVDSFITLEEKTAIKTVKVEVSGNGVLVPVGTMKAAAGSTWREWLTSEYNTSDFIDPIIYCGNSKCKYDTQLIGEKDYVFERQLEPGFYDENDNLLIPWNEMLNKGIDFEYDTDFLFGQTMLPAPNMLWVKGTGFGGTKPNPVYDERTAEVRKIVISGTVRHVGSHTFRQKERITSIILNEGVEEIGEGAFYQTTNLKNIAFPSTLKKIEKDAFEDSFSASPTTIVLPESLMSIGEYAFGSCTYIAEVYFNQKTTLSLGKNVFFNGNSYYPPSINTILYFKNSTVRNQFTTEHYNATYVTKSTNYNW